MLRSFSLIVFFFLVTTAGPMPSDDIDRELLQQRARPVAYFLTVPGVIEELDLTDSQILELKPVILEFRKKYNSRPIIPTSAVNGAFDQVEVKAYPSIDKALEQMLLPHQMLRLKQIQIQKVIQLSNDSHFGLRVLGSILKLDDEQEKKIAQAAKKADDEILKEVQEFADMIREKRKTQQRKAIAELNPEQKKVYETLVGDEFLQVNSISIWMRNMSKKIDLKEED